MRLPPTTGTTPTEFSFDDSVPPPKLVNTGTNYVEIFKTLERYANWLGAHRPDPALASNVLAPGSTVLRLFSRDLTRLRDNGRREIELLGSPSKFTVLSVTSSAFSISAVEDVLAHQVVVASGRITSEVRYSAPTTYLNLAVLVRDHWYLAAIDEQQPAHVHL